ncbi:MAG: twin transmembrane helix small protein [Thiobacillaceae bacterium]|jgi:hypothetical protein|nr:twin transmembrane helix small protein [Thiobacillaceae bacterium]
MRILIYLVLVLILLSLGSALVYLVRDRGEGERAIRALTWRIGLSLGLFILLMAGHYLGVIAPAVS